MLTLSCPQTTVQVENLHGSGACVAREHKQYFISMLLFHTFLSFSRHLVLKRADYKLETLRNQLERCQRRRAGRLNGKCLFLADSCKSALQLCEDEDQRKSTAQVVIQTCGSAWSSLSEHEKLAYNQEALVKRAELQDNIDMSILSAQSKLELHESRRALEAEEAFEMLTAATFSFTDVDKQELRRRWASSEYSRRAVRKADAACRKKVDKVSQDVVDKMHYARRRFLGPSSVELKTAEWCRDVCRRATAFRGTVLVFEGAKGNRLFYAVMFCFVKEHEMCLQPLKLILEGESGV